MEKITRIEKEKKKEGDSSDGPRIAPRPSARRRAFEWRAHRRDFLPEDKNARGNGQRSGVNDIGFLVENHAGKAEHRGPQSGAIAVRPQRQATPSEKHGEEHEPRLMDGISSVENAGGRNGEGQRGPAGGLASEPSPEHEKDRNAEQAGDDYRQAQSPEIAPEQFLRDKDGVKMPRPVEIGRIVIEKAGLAQAIGEVAVDAFVEMGRFQVKQDKTQAGGQHRDGDEVPGQRSKLGRQVHGSRIS